MSQRRQALWRIWAFIWSITAAALITGLVVLVGFVWGAADVLWSLVVGRNDLNEGSRPARIIKGTLEWDVDLLIYALTGNAEFRWLPSW